MRPAATAGAPLLAADLVLELDRPLRSPAPRHCLPPTSSAVAIAGTAALLTADLVLSSTVGELNGEGATAASYKIRTNLVDAGEPGGAGDPAELAAFPVSRSPELTR